MPTGTAPIAAGTRAVGFFLYTFPSTDAIYARFRTGTGSQTPASSPFTVADATEDGPPT